MYENLIILFKDLYPPKLREDNVWCFQLHWDSKRRRAERTELCYKCMETPQISSPSSALLHTGHKPGKVGR